MKVDAKVDEIKLTIQIVNFRSRHYLERCLFSISKNLPSGIKAEVLIVNNDEEKISELRDKWEDLLDLRIIELGNNVGFGKAHNAGFQYSKGEIILFLNPDTEVYAGSLQLMIEALETDLAISVIGPLLVDASGNIQPECFGSSKTPLSIIKNKIFCRSDAAGKNIFEADWVSGGAMLVRREIFEKLKGFDEKFFMYFEDVDFCLRVKKSGAKVAVNPKARIFHESGKSFSSVWEKKKYYYASQDHYFRKHFGGAGAAIVKICRWPYIVANILIRRKKSEC